MALKQQFHSSPFCAGFYVCMSLSLWGIIQFTLMYSTQNAEPKSQTHNLQVKVIHWKGLVQGEALALF